MRMLGLRNLVLGGNVYKLFGIIGRNVYEILEFIGRNV